MNFVQEQLITKQFNAQLCSYLLSSRKNQQLFQKLQTRPFQKKMP